MTPEALDKMVAGIQKVDIREPEAEPGKEIPPEHQIEFDPEWNDRVATEGWSNGADTLK